MLMSEFGGFIKLINVMFLWSVYPITQFLYFMVMIKRLYFANCSEEDIFKSENK